MDKKRHDIFDGSWEHMFEGNQKSPGAEPTYPVPVPEKWPVQQFTQVVVHHGQWAQRVAYIWLN